MSHVITSSNSVTSGWSCFPFSRDRFQTILSKRNLYTIAAQTNQFWSSLFHAKLRSAAWQNEGQTWNIKRSRAHLRRCVTALAAELPVAAMMLVCWVRFNPWWRVYCAWDVFFWSDLKFLWVFCFGNCPCGSSICRVNTDYNQYYGEILQSVCPVQNKSNSKHQGMMVCGKLDRNTMRKIHHFASLKKYSLFSKHESNRSLI